MKRIVTQGIYCMEPLEGSREWYWGSDYAQGDLYEAEELYREQHPVSCNRLMFLHYPDGRVAEPVKGREGQYFGRPVFCEGRIQILLVDFPKGEIRIVQYDDEAKQVTTVASLPLTEVEDCYNLMLLRAPLMLARQGNDGKFQLIWPERVEFDVEETESFCARKDGKMYFTRWYKEPDYREEVVVREYPGGEVVEVIPGAWMDLPDGQVWILQ